MGSRQAVSTVETGRGVPRCNAGRATAERAARPRRVLNAGKSAARPVRRPDSAPRDRSTPPIAMIGITRFPKQIGGGNMQADRTWIRSRFAGRRACRDAQTTDSIWRRPTMQIRRLKTVLLAAAAILSACRPRAAARAPTARRSISRASRGKAGRSRPKCCGRSWRRATAARRTSCRAARPPPKRRSRATTCRSGPSSGRAAARSPRRPSRRAP